VPASAEYDPQADALYVRVREGTRARTVELDERHYVDVDDEGAALGFEVLYPRMGIRLAELCHSWPLMVDEVADAITAVLGQSAPMTTTAAVEVFGVPYATFSTPGGAAGPATTSRSMSVPPELLVG
jgi:uncharacterized protein YuzE